MQKTYGGLVSSPVNKMDTYRGAAVTRTTSGAVVDGDIPVGEEIEVEEHIPNNVIKYWAPEKLNEVSIPYPGNQSGLNKDNNVFNTPFISHEFENGIGTIIFEDDVTAIGTRAFYNCGITSIFIPASVTHINDYIVSNCNDLILIRIDSNNTVYDSRNKCNAIIETSTNTLFLGCSGTLIPRSVTIIGGHAFSGCINLTSITIPSNVTSIEDYAFSGCTGLTSVTLYNGITKIGDSTFFRCTNLSSITIPNSVTNIGNSAFLQCSSLTSIVIPDSVTSIGSYTFSNCSGLTSVTISNSVTSIGQQAFNDCRGLTSFTIPNNMTSIGEEAFKGCDGLTSIIIPSSVTSIGRQAFSCKNLVSITVSSTLPPNTINDPRLFEVNGNVPSALVIYVPAESVDAYKTAGGWSNYADRIQAIPEE